MTEVIWFRIAFAVLAAYWLGFLSSYQFSYDEQFPAAILFAIALMATAAWILLGFCKVLGF